MDYSLSDQFTHRVEAESLLDFCENVFTRLGVEEQDSKIAAEVLVAADLRGVFSHGVAHLRRYVQGLRNGTILARPLIRTVVESPSTATIDAGAGLGPPAAFLGMQLAIDKALDVGSGFVAIRNSNHFGIAGYYAMMALPHDCIGLAMTNASPMVVPTFGRNALFGTNPISVAAPAKTHRPFVLDMATSTVALGKLEVADQLNVGIPLGWAIDSNGQVTEDAHRALTEFRARAGGGLLPLGGAGESLAGYKGYGLALWVEIFSALLAGAAFANLTYPKSADGMPLPANIGHFFGAWRIDAFRPAHEFREAMDELLAVLKNAPKAQDRSRIFVHGEKEFESAERHSREGIPLNATVAKDLQSLAQELGLTMPTFKGS